MIESCVFPLQKRHCYPNYLLQQILIEQLIRLIYLLQQVFKILSEVAIQTELIRGCFARRRQAAKQTEHQLILNSQSPKRTMDQGVSRKVIG